MATQTKTPGKGWLARRAVEIGAFYLAEKVRSPHPTTVNDVPGNAEQVTPEWLSAFVCKDVPGAKITTATHTGGSSGSATRVAMRVTYNDAGQQAGLPAEIFVKLAATYQQRVQLTVAHVAKGETDFYGTLRPKVEFEAPHGYGGVVNDRSGKSAAIMEDVAATKGATFVEPVHPLTRAQIEDVIENLALFHGGLWEDPDLRLLKTPRDHYNNIAAFLDMGKRCEVGMERAKSVIAPALLGQSAKLWEGTRRQLEIATDQMPATLLHGDAHVGQMYINADGSMGICDWQVVMRGGWAFDYAYFVSSACEPEDRRAWDRELLELYLERLGEAGGQAPTFDEAWKLYCQNLFYPYSAWAFTIGRAAHQPVMQPDEYSLAILKRMTAAIHENNAFKAIGL